MNLKASAASTASDLEKHVHQIRSRDDFLSFLQNLIGDLRDHPDGWENRDLSSFLEALGAWIQDMDGFYLSRGEAILEQPNWKVLGQMLVAARVYE